MLTRLFEGLVSSLIERTAVVSPNSAQVPLAHAALVFARGTHPPDQAHATTVYLAAVEALKHVEPMAAAVLTRHSLGSRQITTLIADALDGPDTDSRARLAVERTGQALQAAGLSGPFRLHPLVTADGREYLVVFFEPAVKT